MRWLLVTVVKMPNHNLKEWLKTISSYPFGEKIYQREIQKKVIKPAVETSFIALK